MEVTFPNFFIWLTIKAIRDLGKDLSVKIVSGVKQSGLPDTAMK